MLLLSEQIPFALYRHRRACLALYCTMFITTWSIWLLGVMTLALA
jgi:hypothetical protein